MAIVINGNGTVTGISVGGLPDDGKDYEWDEDTTNWVEVEEP